jgi:hypothetical protein
MLDIGFVEKIIPVPGLKLPAQPRTYQYSQQDAFFCMAEQFGKNFPVVKNLHSV